MRKCKNARMKMAESGNRARIAEELERRVLLSSAIAAFGGQATLGVGVTPEVVAVADLNRDGKLDLVTANQGDDTVSVLLGNGDGTFGGQIKFTTGFYTSAVAIADLNGDGKPDLAVANLGAASVGVLIGNGDGTFGLMKTFGAGSYPRAVVAADVNGDGKIDMVLANYFGNNVSVLLGNGNGTFAAQKLFSTQEEPTSVAAGDFNGDGKADLAVTNRVSNSVSVLLGNGNGTFVFQKTFGTGSAPISVAIGDFNGDGKLDLAASNYEGNTVSVLLGNGDGTFLPQAAFATGVAPGAVTVGDVNVDGKLDLVAANSSGSEVGVLVGNGDGTFKGQRTFGTDGGPGSVAVADLNSDGRPDLVTANSITGDVSVLLGDVPPVVTGITRQTAGPITSNSSLSWVVTFSEPVTGVDESDFVVVIDGTNAGAPDSVGQLNPSLYIVSKSGLSSSGGTTVGLKLVDNGSIVNGAGNPLGAGVPNYGALQTYAAGGGSPESVTMADVNGDGRADALLSPSEGAVVGVALGNGDGTFQSPRTFAVQYHPISISAVDVNGDGRLDMVVANYGDYPFGHTVSVLLGNGDGTFGAQQTYEVGLRPRFLTMADVNGDGRPDVLVTKSNGVAAGENVGVLLGNGDGTFGAMMTFGIGAFSKSIATLDANGDGRVDMVVANEFNNTVGLLLGNGDGTFQGQRTFATGPYPWSVTTGDVNGDGKADVVVADRGGRGVSVLLGNGDGTFQARQSFAVDFAPDSVVIADMNGDGRADVVVGHASGTVGVLLGNGNGTFGSCMTFVAGASLSGAAVSDVNRDGRPDIVGAVWSKTTFSVLLADASGGFAGQKYTIGVSSPTVTGTAGNDSITLSRDANNGDVIDWTMGTTQGQVGANDPAGLTINGVGGTDAITLNYANGNALPGILHLNGTFSASGFTPARTLAGTVLDVGRSTVFFTYSPGSSPAAAIRAALSAGWNGGSWNGTSAGGVITSSAAAGNVKHNIGIGWADSADGSGVNTVANSVELKYTLYGDANLNGVVDIFDLNALLPHFNGAGNWTGGDSTYNGGVDIFDLNALLPNFNTNLGSQVSAAVGDSGTGASAAPAGSASSVTAEAVNAAGNTEKETGKRGDRAARQRRMRSVE